MKSEYPILLEPTDEGFDFVFSDGYRISADEEWTPSELLKIKNALTYAYNLGAGIPNEKPIKKSLITEKVVKGNIKETK